MEGETWREREREREERERKGERGREGESERDTEREAGVGEVHTTGEGHVPSVQNVCEVCCRNNRTLCIGSWPSPIRQFAFSPLPS